MRRMALGRAHYKKNGLRSSALWEEWPLLEGRVEWEPTSDNALDWGPYKEPSKNFRSMRLSKKSQGRSSTTRLQKNREKGRGATLSEYEKYFVMVEEKEPFVKMEGMWHRCHFLELKFHFRMCHRNALVNFWQGFLLFVGGGGAEAGERGVKERRGYCVLTNLTRAS